MTQKKTNQPQITHDHEGHAHVNCPGLAAVQALPH